MNYQRPLLWSLRLSSALGLMALTLTQEIGAVYLYLCWLSWAASFWLDSQAVWQKKLRRLETAVVIGMIAVFVLDFYVWGQTLFIGVAHFLLLFQTFKMLGLKERKDSLQILMFSFFQMLSACTLSVDLWQAAILLLLIPIATAGLFWHLVNQEAELQGHKPSLQAQRPFQRLVFWMCAGAIPINIALASTMFLVFPRLAFRNAFAGLGSGRSGYSEQVNLAQAGVLNLDSSPILWMQITPEKDRDRWGGYLRGTTLNHFDGRQWSRQSSAIPQTLFSGNNGVYQLGLPADKKRRGLRQTITLVNTSGATLFGSPFIGEAMAPLANLQTLPDGSVRWTLGWRKPLHYTVVSYDTPLISRGAVPNAQQINYLQLPKLSFDRTRTLLQQITQNKRTPQAQADAIQDYLRKEFQYSLNLGRPVENPVEDFLFNRKQGPCGYFASAMATMLRLQGIPARVVAGYYKGTWNEQLGQYLIRERDAHAWVEAYIPDKGWVLFDPSPRPVSAPTTQRWLSQVQQQWEFLNYHWARLVIEYDLYSQVRTVQEIQSNTQRMNNALTAWIDRHLMGRGEGTAESREQGAEKHRGVLGLIVLVVGLLAGGFFISLRKRKALLDPRILFYKKFLDYMARQGFPKNTTETGWEYARRLEPLCTPTHPKLNLPYINTITRRYYSERFRASRSEQE